LIGSTLLTPGTVFAKTLDPANLPRLKQAELRLLHEGPAGLGLTSNQLEITYNARLHEIGQAIRDFKRYGDDMIEEDDAFLASIMEDIAGRYISDFADYIDQAVMVEDYEADVADPNESSLPAHQIPPPIRPRPGQPFSWHSSHLGLSVIHVGREGESGGRDVFEYCADTFPAKFRRQVQQSLSESNPGGHKHVPNADVNNEGVTNYEGKWHGPAVSEPINVESVDAIVYDGEWRGVGRSA
jgi:hypothetical protein